MRKLDAFELDDIKNRLHAFTWGPAIKVHEIGEYAVVEYQERLPDNSPADRKSRVLFHGFVKGLTIHESFESLDAALVGCIAYKSEGGNGRAAGYFMKMIAK